MSYAKLICNNNAFLQTITVIPVEDFQHVTLKILFSTNKNTDSDQTTLLDVIEEQSWCLNVEKMNTQNKILFLTIKDQLEKEHKWMDNELTTNYSTILMIKSMSPHYAIWVHIILTNPCWRQHWKLTWITSINELLMHLSQPLTQTQNARPPMSTKPDMLTSALTPTNFLLSSWHGWNPKS